MRGVAVDHTFRMLWNNRVEAISGFIPARANALGSSTFPYRKCRIKRAMTG